MDDSERDTRQEDDHLEVIDLSVFETTKHSAGEPGPFAPTPSRAPLHSRFTARQRRLQLLTTSSIVVVALLVILGGIAPLRDAVALRLFGPTPTPTATLTPGD